jgi:DMSO/TMAO reductase YedYZ molybdopterin-dependent catalytic subunit
MGGIPELIAALIDDHRRVEAMVTGVSARLAAALSSAGDVAIAGNAVAEVQALQRLLENDVALHIEQEEQILFPAVRDAVQGIAPLLEDMIAEHDEVRARRDKLGRTLARLDDDHALLQEAAVRLGEVARLPDHPGIPLESTALQQLSDAVRQLDWVLQGHFTGEEDGVFLPAEDLLSAETFIELARRSAALASAWHAARADRLRGTEQARNPRRLPSLPIFPFPGGLTAVSNWCLRVDGLVHAPLVLDLDSVRSLPAVTLAADFSCEEGWAVPELRWLGVPLRTILALADVRPEASYLTVSSGDFVALLPLSSLREGEPLLAYELNDAPLPPEHGGPLRMVASDVACYRSVKWVDRIELTAAAVEETAKRIAGDRIARR